MCETDYRESHLTPTDWGGRGNKDHFHNNNNIIMGLNPNPFHVWGIRIACFKIDCDGWGRSRKGLGIDEYEI